MLRRVPFVSAMCYVPLPMVGDVAALKRELTVSVNPLQGGRLENLYVDAIARTDETEDVKAYDESKPGYLGVPRAFGLDRFSHLRFVDRTAHGVRTTFKAKTITPRDDQQRAFWGELANVCTGPKPVDYVANARTGSGKTAGDLWLTHKIGVPTLIVVHTNKLKSQWVGDLLKKHGIKFLYGPDFLKYVGIAQQDRCDYKGKLVVIGLLPSLARRTYPTAFYRHFGKVTIDEVHKAAAPLMSEALKKFPAAIRGGYTATNRPDSLRKLIDWHLGAPRVVSAQETPAPTVYKVKFQGQYQINTFSEYTKITSLAAIPQRNEFLANLMVTRGVRRGRRFVALSDRTKQLQDLRDRLIALGVSPKLIGLHVGEYYTGKWKVTTQLPTGGWKALGVYSTKREATAAGQRTQRPFRVSEEKVKVSLDELDQMTERCPYLLASYGIFDTGVDVSTLDQGYECTPRGNVKQAIGRVCRTRPGKPTPEWYSVDDLIVTPRGAFSEAKPEPYFIDKTRARLTSFAFHKAHIKVMYHA